MRALCLAWANRPRSQLRFASQVSGTIILSAGARSQAAERICGVVTDVRECAGGIDRDEMFTTFNIGVGMVLVIDPDNVGKVSELLPSAVAIGEVVEESGVQIK